MVSGLQRAARDACDKPTAPVLLGQADGQRPGACPSHVQDRVWSRPYALQAKGRRCGLTEEGLAIWGLGTRLLVQCGREVVAVLLLAQILCLILLFLRFYFTLFLKKFKGCFI